MPIFYWQLLIMNKQSMKKKIFNLYKSKRKFLIVINSYPNTDYAIDASFKLDLINDILASKEMYIGRYYLDKKKWISAINRFRTVVDEYDTQFILKKHFIDQLRHIIYLVINEAEKYAKLLGYNFQSSQWYEKSYFI